MRDSTTRTKQSPSPLPRATEVRPIAATLSGGDAPRPVYASILARARAAGLFALCTIAPLGALAGSVSACGAAAPVRPSPMMQADPNAQVAPPTGAGTQPAPLTSIAPPTTNPPPAPE
jgi:hypothetical protein